MYFLKYAEMADYMINPLHREAEGAKFRDRSGRDSPKATETSRSWRHKLKSFKLDLRQLASWSERYGTLHHLWVSSQQMDQRCASHWKSGDLNNSATSCLTSSVVQLSLKPGTYGKTDVPRPEKCESNRRSPQRDERKSEKGTDGQNATQPPWGLARLLP